MLHIYWNRVCKNDILDAERVHIFDMDIRERYV